MQLRPLVYDHQHIAYDQLIKLTWETLSQFGLNDKKLRGKLGATVVLHTHSRALNFHPHVHIVIPAGAIDTRIKVWRPKKGKFLFEEKNIAKVFRGKWFQMMKEQGWKVKGTLPKKWIVDCRRVGNGEKAITYLGRYLYRGVIREKDILSCKDGKVIFRYTENDGTIRTRELEGADFLRLLLRHVLPKGFRRSRDYGFLHGNNKRVIHLLHLILKMSIPQPKEKSSLQCKHCGGEVTVVIRPNPKIYKAPSGQCLANLEMPMH